MSVPAKEKALAITVPDGKRRVIVRIGPGVQGDIEHVDYQFKSVADLATAYIAAERRCAEHKKQLETIALALNGG